LPVEISKNFSYHHQQSLGCRQSTDCQRVDDNEFRNKPALSFRNDDDPKMVSRIWHKQNAEIEKERKFKTIVFYLI